MNDYEQTRAELLALLTHFRGEYVLTHNMAEAVRRLAREIETESEAESEESA